MSTFDGLVDEFANIRIDYFRHRPDQVRPQACFLSHVHSDHLQGLETLKMPFVYCSMATKKILLRMEKYPHRINFAKGILEARKQTYKSLRLVLRALPLETPVEIELGPKSKIRVTLFDANHCPGAVMFLIEGHNKAVLYTGDIRAEPWWVNSIVRSPLLIPYACGAKTLDCIYLDTTFASHDDIYANFPTKADGLKELLSKVNKCPRSCLFYFRSWTLGYEDVLITLSSFLRSQIHVDAYQLRLFRSLGDDVNLTDRGPALAGFEYGNQRQFGCLTDNTDVLIHSCEPGTDCHDKIKEQADVVWITPIISRLRDGTEVAEVGAGGGGGDLYQIPQLEMVDEATLEALKKICAGSAQHEHALSQLEKAFSAARAKGDSEVSLEGLVLDQEEEITIKQFMQLVSSKDENAKKRGADLGQKIIHFPYSRHSSFSELRHLISSFRPKDVCPCTVDVHTWSEEVSIQSLFGDLCSDNTFKYDRDIRPIAHNVRNLDQRRKRKRSTDDNDDSQRTATQESVTTEEVYTSAKTSMRKSDAVSGNQDFARQRQPDPDQLNTQTPTPIRRLHKTLSNRFAETPGREMHEGHNASTSTELQSRAFVGHRQHSNGSDEVDNGLPSTSSPRPPDHLQEDDSYHSDDSVPYSIFDSQPRPTPDTHEDNTNLTPETRPMLHKTSSPDGDKLTGHNEKHKHPIRIETRMEAYHAAKAVLESHDLDPWTDLRLRSIGWKGHTEAEIEL